METLGTKLKRYESITTETRLIPTLPVCVRVDGRAFHTFCRGLNKPFDTDMVETMQETCRELVKETKAMLGYVQSDEITLVFECPEKMDFNGRLFKITSTIASQASVYFVLNAMQTKLKDKVIKEKPVFDCRVFQVPNLEVLAQCLLWRENDAAKNSVAMVAQANFSHSCLQGKTTSEMNEMLFQEKGINFNDLPTYLKRGTYFKRVKVFKKLDEQTLNKIPLDKQPKVDVVERTEVQKVVFPRLSKVSNKVDMLFNDASPIFYDSAQ